jgi:hypothetical protein
MADAGRSELPARVALGVVDMWRRLNFEQRVAGVAALLLIVSTFGPFSFVEAAIVLVGLSVLFLLRRRAEGRRFHLPFGDGTVIAAAGAWSGVLILIRIFDRPLGQGLLALVCAAILLVAGLSERRKHLPDDLPQADAADHQRDSESVDPREVSATERLPSEGRRRRRRSARGRIEDEPTAVRERRPAAREPAREQLFDPESGTIDELRSVHDSPTEPLPPPEFDLPPRTRRQPPGELPPPAPDERTEELPPPPPPPPRDEPGGAR